MSHELICSWLGLAPGEWPPDHYRLLGLTPGEGDAALIEQRVHERLDTVRRYQMMHPEQATEAMNRLAQAFVCLTQPDAKQAYDAELLGRNAPVAAATAQEAASDRNSLMWLYAPLPAAPGPSAPPPLPALARPAAATPPPLPPLPARPTPPAGTTAIAPATPASPAYAPARPPVNPIVEAAQSGRARRGLASRRALYRRVAQTRKLLHTWDEVGKVLAAPRRRLGKTAEVQALFGELEEVRSLLRGFPPLLGEAGQPGYLVLALPELTPAEAQALSPQQREGLARDWKAAGKLLAAHRDFLRQELRARRGWTFRERLAHRVRAAFRDQPAAVLFLLGLLALNIAIWRSAGALWEKFLSPGQQPPAAHDAHP